MPPFTPPPVIWHGVTRDVYVHAYAPERIEVSALPVLPTTTVNVKYKVVVAFTRYGYDNKTQQRVEEVLETYIVATKLSRKQADDLQRTVSDVCSQSYAHGYADCRKQR